MPPLVVPFVVLLLVVTFRCPSIKAGFALERGKGTSVDRTCASACATSPRRGIIFAFLDLCAIGNSKASPVGCLLSIFE